MILNSVLDGSSQHVEPIGVHCGENAKHKLATSYGAGLEKLIMSYFLLKVDLSDLVLSVVTWSCKVMH